MRRPQKRKTCFWNYLETSKQTEDFFKVLWHSQNIWTLKSLFTIPFLFLGGGIELAAYILAFVFVNSFGRKYPLMLYLFLSGILCISVVCVRHFVPGMFQKRCMFYKAIENRYDIIHRPSGSWLFWLGL